MRQELRSFRSGRIIAACCVLVASMAVSVGHLSGIAAAARRLTSTIAGGGSHSLVLRTDGTLWTFGDNRYGQLGTTTNSGTDNANPTPTQVLTNVTAIAAGSSHSLVLKGDGTLWAFGANNVGELGTPFNSGTSNANPTPIQVLTNVTAIAAGSGHSLALKGDGTLWTFGANYYGQLGTTTNNGTSNANPTPTQVLTNLTAIAADSYHSLVLKSDGTLWTFGSNYYGQLGTTTNNGTSNANPTPTQVLSGVAPAAPFVSVAPVRLLDTRALGETVDTQYAAIGLRNAGTITELPVAGRAGVPTDATTVVLNVTATDTRGAGFVTVWPCGTPQPNASNLNYDTGVTIANAVTTKLGVNGKVCLYTQTATHLIADLDGYHPNNSTFVSSIPARLLDSRSNVTTIDTLFAGIGLREAGTITELPVAGRAGVPTDATTVVLNVTATDTRGAGFVTVWPCGTPQPNASNLNYATGATIANAVTTKLGANGKVCLYTQTATHLITDLDGYHPNNSTFVSSIPARLLDSRSSAATIDGQYAEVGPRVAGSITELQITGRAGVPNDAAAVVLNVTATDTKGAGFATVWPCGTPQPNASNLNYDSGATIANAVTTKLGANGKVCLYTQTTTHLITDLDGYYPND